MLTRYLDDVDAFSDHDWTENQIRLWTVGHTNWQIASARAVTNVRRSS